MILFLKTLLIVLGIICSLLGVFMFRYITNKNYLTYWYSLVYIIGGGCLVYYALTKL